MQVVRAAQLVGAPDLQVLALEPDLRAGRRRTAGRWVRAVWCASRHPSSRARRRGRIRRRRRPQTRRRWEGTVRILPRPARTRRPPPSIGGVGAHADWGRRSRSATGMLTCESRKALQGDTSPCRAGVRCTVRRSPFAAFGPDGVRRSPSAPSRRPEPVLPAAVQSPGPPSRTPRPRSAGPPGAVPGRHPRRGPLARPSSARRPRRPPPRPSRRPRRRQRHPEHRARRLPQRRGRARRLEPGCHLSWPLLAGIGRVESGTPPAAGSTPRARPTAASSAPDSTGPRPAPP